MFERYTEKARRVIFFARYEASEFGSPMIDTDHLLLGLVREEKMLCFRWLPRAQPETIRAAIEKWAERRPKIPTSVDLPLSPTSRNVLDHAKNEADRLNSRHIGTEHLFLGLLGEEDKTCKLLYELGADLAMVRARFEKEQQQRSNLELANQTFLERVRSESAERLSSPGPIEIHGLRWNRSYILDGVKRCKKYNWHWQKVLWKPRDVVLCKRTGKVSFDLELVADTANFELVKGGWKKDHCSVCGWELFEAADHHGTGYTNGHQWICLECHDKFWDKPDFISGAYSDLT
jgi:hypothetical protein